MSYKATKPSLVSVLYLSMRYTVLFSPFLCIVSFCCYVWLPGRHVKNRTLLTYFRAPCWSQKLRVWVCIHTYISVYLCPVRDEIFYQTSRLKTGQSSSKPDTWQPYCYVFRLLVVLVKLSVLAKWLARKTPLRKPNRGDGIVSRKPRPKNACDFLGSLYCFMFLLCICVVSCPCMI